MIARSLVRHLLRQVDVAEAAQHSVLDHHVPGLDYLCLQRSPGLTVKVYLTDPARLRPQCSGYLVHPHDHRYAFDTTVLAGLVRHTTFTQWSVERGGAGCYAYSPAQHAFLPAEQRYELTAFGSVTYGAGESYHVAVPTVHTIAVPRTAPTCLLLLQYADEHDQSTRCFSWYGPPVVQPSCYRSPTVGETAALVQRVHDLALGQGF